MATGKKRLNERQREISISEVEVMNKVLLKCK
jgi:hypothetical protein